MSETIVNPINILSDITVHSKYAKHLGQQNRRETWVELCYRNRDMHIKKFPFLKDEIIKLYDEFVIPKKVLPSMRSMQFAGKPIEINPTRIFNCAYLPIDSWEAFHETMFLLLGGTGVGYSVQHHHIEKLPEVVGPGKRSRRFVIGDSIEGWADAIKVLMKAYFFGKAKPNFIYDDIRAKGALLITSGGKAPGPQPLKDCIYQVTKVLDGAVGRQLTDIECHDIECHIADAVLAGGIRRAALISLFSATSEAMMSCKSGSWWELNPQRGRANNSAVLLRHKIDKSTFLDIWEKIEASNSGEPGIYLTNDKDWGTNPCCEIALRPNQFCNLTEINASNITSQEDFNARAGAAAFLGTLQASYTEFHYLRDIWQKNTERDSLLGVSMTGIASMEVFKYDIQEAVDVIKNTNKVVAEGIGINPAARLTAVKPAGTTSLTLGTSSGIHAWHSEYYIRRMRLGKTESLYTYLAIHHPELLEDDIYKPSELAMISVPQKAPEGAVTRHESPIDLLERVKTISKNWIAPGHIDGQNTHNVSATISVDTDEWEKVGEWMWENRNYYNGLSVLPKDTGSYKQAPFQDITKEEYEKLVQSLKSIDLTQVIEHQDNTNLMGEIACGGSGCEIV